ncbi:MAG: transcriptional regulator [Bacteroidota bacterium]
MKKKILVLCTGNSCRSQMAQGYLEFFGGDAVEVYSAGIEAHGVNPRVIAIMQEDGMDISHHTSNTISEYTGIEFDRVITVCDHAKDRSKKKFIGKKPNTSYSVSRSGRKAFSEHLDALEKIIKINAA